VTTPDAAAPQTRPTVVVIGGGIAGLSAAWTLSADTALRVVVLEAAARPGGKLQSRDIGGRAVDVGPDAFVARRPEAVELCTALGLDDELVTPGSRRAYVWARRRLRPLPAGLALGVPTRLGPLARSGILSGAGLGRVAADALRPGPSGVADGTHPDEATVGRPDESVASITDRLGHEVTARLADPLIGGIHAGDTRRMSAAAVFPALLDAARRGGSLMRALRAGSAAPATPETPDAPAFFSLRAGVAGLTVRLADALVARGVELRTSHAARQIALHGGTGPGDPRGDRVGSSWTVAGAHDAVAADGIVLATPAPVAGALLGGVDTAAASILRTVAHASVAVITMRLRRDDVDRDLDGTGFLVPRVDGGLVTACTWLSTKWPHLERPGEVLLRASVGRAGDDRHDAMDDDELTRHVLQELGPLSRVRADPVEVAVTRFAHAFPQYDVGHLGRVDDLERALAPLPAIAVAGAALRGVGIPACIASGRRAAHAVRTALGRGDAP
jgi:oxygen-dependent protoporphyrinogen oxidase